MEDCGSSSVCARHFRLFKLELRELAFPDPWHNTWNDALNSYKQSKEFGVLLSTTLCANACYGPWQGEKWFSELLAGFDSFVQRAGKNDALFQALLPHILHDNGYDSSSILAMGHTPSDLAWQLLTDASFLSKKGDRISTCRWFQWQNRTWQLTRDWHARLLVLLHVCLQLGISTKHVELMRAQQSAEAIDAREPETMAEQKKELQNLREKSQNTLGLLLAIYCQPSVLNLDIRAAQGWKIES